MSCGTAEKGYDIYVTAGHRHTHIERGGKRRNLKPETLNISLGPRKMLVYLPGVGFFVSV